MVLSIKCVIYKGSHLLPRTFSSLSLSSSFSAMKKTQKPWISPLPPLNRALSRPSFLAFSSLSVTMPHKPPQCFMPETSNCTIQMDSVSLSLISSFSRLFTTSLAPCLLSQRFGTSSGTEQYKPIHWFVTILIFPPYAAMNHWIHESPHYTNTI